MFDLHPNETCASTVALFENADWRVLGEGLEHRGTGYFITRETIGMRRGDLWEWPLHLAEKNWCTPRSFRQAFLAALEAFGEISDASLARSFAVGFGLVQSPGTKHAAQAGGTEEFLALGDVVRPRSVNTVKSPGSLPARKRSPGSETRATSRRVGMPVTHLTGEAPRQRATS